MRKVALLLGAILATIARPTVDIPAAAKTKTAVTQTVTLNTQLPSAIESTTQTPNFTTEYQATRQRLMATEVADATKQLAMSGLKVDFAAEYVDAEHRTGTPWQLIAAVHKVETGQSGDTAIASYAGAQGPMQFLPGTFSAFARDGDGDGVANIYDASDAILTGANYLRANGADRGQYINALLGYNHSLAYADYVYGIAHNLGL